jgi:CheY-like chemotaxis protein
MYAEYFRYQGFLPVPVSTARDGLTVAHKVDVIVTGLLLPGDMDGIEFIARLKTDERTKRIPVVVLTACAWTRDRDRAEQAGCDLYLPKPCLPADLLQNVRRLLAASKLHEVHGVPLRADLPSDVRNRHEGPADRKRG